MTLKKDKSKRFTIENGVKDIGYKKEGLDDFDKRCAQQIQIPPNMQAKDGESNHLEIKMIKSKR